MRPFTSIAAALTVSLCLVATLPAQTVSTVPVGFNTSTIAPASNATTPTGNVVAAQFYQIAVFQGALSSVDSSNQISFTGANFGNLTTVPHLARFKTGNSTGRFHLITANTTTQLTLDTSDADSTPDIKGYALTTGAPTLSQTQVAVGDSVEVVPANTLASLFGATGGGIFQTGTSAGQADNVLLFNQKNQTWDTFYPSSSTGHWRQSGNLNPNLDNTVVLPDRGIFILRRSTSTSNNNVTFLGTVPSTTEKTDIAGPGSTFISTRFPVDMTLGGTGPTALNLQAQTAGAGVSVGVLNWQPGSSAGQADNVLLWNPTSKTWDTFYFSSSTNHWRQSGNLDPDVDDKVVPIGSAMFILRRSSSSGVSPTFTKTLTYTL